MESGNALIPWLIIWLAAIFLIVLVRWKRKVAGSGLVYAYLLNLASIHWIAALVHTLPWYSGKMLPIWFPGFHRGWVVEGFKLSTYGMIGFVSGSLFVAPLLGHLLFGLGKKKFPTHLSDPRLPKAYVLTGLLGFFVLPPLLIKIPTVSTLASSSLNLTAIGICLALWKAWQEKRRRKFLKLFIIGLASLPLITLMSQGFVSFGVVAATAVIAFVAGFYRTRWKLVVVAILAGYLGFSFYVTYMRDRNEIREIIWGGEPVSRRVERLFLSASTFEWFNPRDENHLWQIDKRLNQNLFVGTAAEKLSRNQGYAHGETILNAFIGLVPRIIWPGKPKFVGGSEFVSRFTGVRYFGNTTMSIGQVLEFYVNFGSPGVFFGFLFMGTVITIFDSVARQHLLNGDWQGFAFWFLAGLCFLRVEGSLVEIVMTGTTGAITAFLVNGYLQRFRGKRILWANSS